MILDEAHNIEDICRDAAHVILRDDEIANAAKDCQHLSIKRYHDCAIFNIIQKYLTDIIKFLQDIEVEENVSRYKYYSYQIINYKLIFVFTLILYITIIY